MSNSLEDAKKTGYFVGGRNKFDESNRKDFYHWCNRNKKVFIAFRVARKYAELTFDTDTFFSCEDIYLMTDDMRKVVLDRIRPDINLKHPAYQGVGTAWWILNGIYKDRITSLGHDLVDMLNDPKIYQVPLSEW